MHKAHSYWWSHVSQHEFSRVFVCFSKKKFAKEMQAVLFKKNILQDLTSPAFGLKKILGNHLNFPEVSRNISAFSCSATRTAEFHVTLEDIFKRNDLFTMNSSIFTV